MGKCQLELLHRLHPLTHRHCPSSYTTRSQGSPSRLPFQYSLPKCRYQRLFPEKTYLRTSEFHTRRRDLRSQNRRGSYLPFFLDVIEILF